MVRFLALSFVTTLLLGAERTEQMDKLAPDDLATLALLVKAQKIDLKNLLTVPGVTQKKDAQGKSLLHHMSWYDCPGIELLIERAPHLMTQLDNDGRNPLYRAIERSSLQAVKTIVTAWPDFFETRNFPDLFLIVFFAGNFEIFKAIMKAIIERLGDEYREEHKFTDGEGRTIMQMACLFGRYDCIEFLLERFPQMIHDVDERGFTNLHWACMAAPEADELKTATERYLKTVTILCKHKPQLLDTASSNSILPIYLAIQNGFLPLVDSMLEQKPELFNKKILKGVGLVHVACQFGRADIYRLLLQKDPTLCQSKDHLGLTPLDYALIYKHADLAIEIGAARPVEIFSQNSRGTNALIEAVKYDVAAFFSHVLQRNTILKKDEEFQRHLLSFIVVHRSLDCLSIFCEHFPDCFATTTLPCNEQHFRVYLTWDDILETLLDRYPNLILMKNDQGEPLIQCIDQCLKFGESIPAETVQKRRAELDSGRSYSIIFNLLMKYGARLDERDFEKYQGFQHLSKPAKVGLCKAIARFKCLRPLVSRCIDKEDYHILRLLGPESLITAYSTRQLITIVREKFHKAQDKTTILPLLEYFSPLVGLSPQEVFQQLQKRESKE